MGEIIHRCQYCNAQFESLLELSRHECSIQKRHPVVSKNIASLHSTPISSQQSIQVKNSPTRTPLLLKIVLLGVYLPGILKFAISNLQDFGVTISNSNKLIVGYGFILGFLLTLCILTYCMAKRNTGILRNAAPAVLINLYLIFRINVGVIRDYVQASLREIDANAVKSPEPSPAPPTAQPTKRITVPLTDAELAALAKRSQEPPVAKKEVDLKEQFQAAMDSARHSAKESAEIERADEQKARATQFPDFAPLLRGSFINPNNTKAHTTYLKIVSTNGDTIGLGRRYAYDQNEIIVNTSGAVVTIQIGGEQGWTLEFAPPKGKVLTQGEYTNAKRYPLNNDAPGLCFHGRGRSGNTIVGKFMIWELKMDGSEVESMAVDFLQMDSEHGPPLGGMFRYNSSFE